MSDLMSQVQIVVEVRHLRIDTEWTIKEHRPWVLASEYPSLMIPGPPVQVAIPHVRSLHGCVKTQLIDGREMRRRFQRLQHTPEASLDFLNAIGVWSAYEHKGKPLGSGQSELNGPVGSRYFSGYATPIDLGQLWAEQRTLDSQLRKPSLLKSQLGPGPGDDASPYHKAIHALTTRFQNELPLHIEWRKSKPIAVIETITGRELLTATTHLELIQGAKFKVCQRPDCAIMFPVISKHARKYCSYNCAHLMAVRKSRPAKKGSPR